MNLQHPALAPVTTRRLSICLLPGPILAVAVCLLIPAASNAAPTPTPKPATTPAATPAATPMASPTASPVTVVPTRAASYTGTQQMDYLATARDGFIALRQSKSQPFVEAQKALEDAGGVGLRA